MLIVYLIGNNNLTGNLIGNNLIGNQHLIGNVDCIFNF